MPTFPQYSSSSTVRTLVLTPNTTSSDFKLIRLGLSELESYYNCQIYLQLGYHHKLYMHLRNNLSTSSLDWARPRQLASLIAQAVMGCTVYLSFIWGDLIPNPAYLIIFYPLTYFSMAFTAIVKLKIQSYFCICG